MTASASETPAIAGFTADGDATLLAAYEFPASLTDEFEAAAKAAVAQTVERGSGMWLTYRQLPAGESSHASTSSKDAAFFTVHFPDNLNELTEPAATTSGLSAVFGEYRVSAELTRQVPDWCSTVVIDAEKLEYGHVEYLWLEPNALDAAAQLLAERASLLKYVYGSGSDGNFATEGFVAMSAPFQVMVVLFSSEESLVEARQRLLRELEAKDLAEELLRIERILDTMVAKREYRSGRFRRDLSAYW